MLLPPSLPRTEPTSHSVLRCVCTWQPVDEHATVCVHSGLSLQTTSPALSALLSPDTQHALRLIAFEKLHLVLGVEPLPPPSTPKAGTKRRAEEEVPSEETEVKKAKPSPEPSTAST